MLEYKYVLKKDDRNVDGVMSLWLRLRNSEHIYIEIFKLFFEGWDTVIF
jgi:hypothetical protein